MLVTELLVVDVTVVVVVRPSQSMNCIAAGKEDMPKSFTPYKSKKVLVPLAVLASM